MAFESRAVIRYLRLSPQKTRRVITLVRGRKVNEALAYLAHLPHAAAQPLAKAIQSAAANAEDVHGLSPEDLVIKKVTADEGPRLKRYRSGARGRIKPIVRRTTHITVVVGQEEEK